MLYKRPPPVLHTLLPKSESILDIKCSTDTVIQTWRYLLNKLTFYPIQKLMYLFQKLREIVRSNSCAPVVRFRPTEVEIDNPVSESKILVPAYEITPDSAPDFVDMPASAYGLDTIVNAGLSLKPSQVVTSSFLRETEKFIDKLNSTKID